MENDMPKIDIPEDLIVGTNITKGLLSLYTNYPCHLKASIFVLCMGGYLEASINLARYKVKPFDFITILPDTILQIHKAEGDLRIYFMGFSAGFMKSANIVKSILDIFYMIKENPVLHLVEKSACLFEEYLVLLIKVQEHGKTTNREVIRCVLLSLLHSLNDLYNSSGAERLVQGKSERISKDFAQMVVQHYTKERSVSFYAQKLEVTAAHLSTTIKQATGKTPVEIISAMVIMDAKNQLKSDNLPICEIAYSLNFTNMSFFGKYFKRYVGMSPQEYRNS